MFQGRLYQLRKDRGISQEELANIVGVSRQAVQKWESGASRPDMDNLVALSQYFGVTLDFLLRGISSTSDPASPPPPAHVCGPWHYEYRSKRTLFGLPLVHINLGRFGFHWARGILAVGNIASGGLALGGLSFGVVSVGGLSLGALCLGGLAAGLAAFGGLALGALFACGGLAVSFGLACGGVAVGGAYALGGAATAWNIAAGGAASAHIAIGDAVDGAITFPQDAWGPGTGEEIRAAILQQFPSTPAILVKLFSSFH